MRNRIHAQGGYHSDAVTHLGIGEAPRALSPRPVGTVYTTKFTPTNVKIRALAEALQQRVCGEVRFDDGSRALYATDGSNYRQTLIGVVIPQTLNDVIETVTIARRYAAPVLARGGGTS